MLGLVLSLIEWETNYPQNADSVALLKANVFSEILIAVVTGHGLLAIVLKYRMEATWRNYDNPIRFYRKILR